MSKESGARFRLKHPWYNLYVNAKQRCENPKAKSYKYCGGIGIKFRLTMHQVEILFNWHGGHWMKSPSLDRIDPSKDYVFDNCRVIEKSINERLPHDAELAEAFAAEWSE
jgi:hypothetical protein